MLCANDAHAKADVVCRQDGAGESERKKNILWKIRIDFLQIKNVAISHATREWKSLIVCSVIVLYTELRIVREIQNIWTCMVKV